MEVKFYDQEKERFSKRNCSDVHGSWSIFSPANDCQITRRADRHHKWERQRVWDGKVTVSLHRQALYTVRDGGPQPEEPIETGHASRKHHPCRWRLELIPTPRFVPTAVSIVKTKPGAKISVLETYTAVILSFPDANRPVSSYQLRRLP